MSGLLEAIEFIVIHAHAIRIVYKGKTYTPIEWMKFISLSFHRGYFPDGRVEQMKPLTEEAWHAGVSRYVLNGKVYRNFNKFSVGLEIYIDNAYNWETFTEQIEKRESFTNKMYDALSRDCAEICYKNKLNPRERIVQHSEISGEDVRPDDPKIDAGAGFDWERLVSMTEARMLEIHSENNGNLIT